MKRFKKMMAIAIVAVMTLAYAMPMAFAADPTTYGTASQAHKITVVNNGNDAHTYSAYQVFAGNLDADEDVLTDIAWGTGVNASALLAALKASTDTNLGYVAAVGTEGEEGYVAEHNDFTNCTTASDVAKVLATDKYKTAANLDAVARIIDANKADVSGTANVSAPGNGGTAVLNVTGDGYYMVLDTTTTIPDGDTRSKIMLNVVQDVEIDAKATQIKPDKEIVGATENVKAGTAAIGDEVTFQVVIDVPDTTNYKDHFVFVMNDKLPKGLTFKSVDSIKIYKTDDVNANAANKVAAGATALKSLTDSTDYEVTVAPNGTENTVANQASFVAPSAPTAPDTYVTVAGGQVLKVVFKNFKTLAETNNTTINANYIGQKIVVTYKAVVNDDATYGPTSNKNEVEFKYSNDPNHDYDGDDFDSTDPQGTTPKSTTETYVTALELFKYDNATGSKVALPGAEFKLTGTNILNTVLVTGEKFVKKTDFEAANAAAAGTYVQADTNNYYELKDGTYTTTVAGSTTSDGRTVNETQYVDKDVIWYKVKVDDVVTEKDANYAAKATSNNDGLIEFKGLKAGDYTIEETVAPEGYNKLDGTATLSITWTDPNALRDQIAAIDAAAADANRELTADETAQKAALNTQINNGGFALSGTDAAKFSFATSSDGDTIATIRYEVENNKGSVLPSTGGIGTTLFYLIGAILIIGAGVLLVTRRRVNTEE